MLTLAVGTSCRFPLGAFVVAAVWIRRHDNAPDCDVIVAIRDDQILIRCKNYDQAVKWARMECKSYRVADFAVQ